MWRIRCYRSEIFASMGRMLRRSSTTVAAALLCAAALPQTAQAQTWGAPVLVENFNGSSIDTSKWMIYHSPGAERNPRTGRAATVSAGVLRLKGGMYGGKDLSGGVATRHAQRYGRWEVRFRAEAGAGYTPVALLWPVAQGEGDDYAEVDFAEIVDPRRRGGGIFVHGGHGRAQRQLRADFTRWHAAAVDWLPGRLTFWLDGRRVWDYRGAYVPSGERMGLALQNDVVCEPRCRDASTPDTVSMYVDWVKVYQPS
jgi:licheninase